MRRGCDVMTSNRINVVFAVMMNSSGKGTMLIWNGIPIGMHLALWAYSPWPPWACSAIFSSWMRLNSSFNGACCAAPAGLLGSYRGPPPIAFQRHWPDQSGYLDSSCAEAAVAVANVAAIVSTPIRSRTIMGCSPCASVGNAASWRPAADVGAHYGRSGPFQARQDCASHHPVLVALRQKAQLFGEMRDALAVACLDERVRDVGSPMAALRTVGVEYALQVHRHVAERIRFERIAERTRQLDADVRIFGERNGLINRRRDVLGDPVGTAR